MPQGPQRVLHRPHQDVLRLSAHVWELWIIRLLLLVPQARLPGELPLQPVQARTLARTAQAARTALAVQARSARTARTALAAREVKRAGPRGARRRALAPGLCSTPAPQPPFSQPASSSVPSPYRRSTAGPQSPMRHPTQHRCGRRRAAQKPTAPRRPRTRPPSSRGATCTRASPTTPHAPSSSSSTPPRRNLERECPPGTPPVYVYMHMYTDRNLGCAWISNNRPGLRRVHVGDVCDVGHVVARNRRHARL